MIRNFFDNTFVTFIQKRIIKCQHIFKIYNFFHKCDIFQSASVRVGKILTNILKIKENNLQLQIKKHKEQPCQWCCKLKKNKLG